MLIKAIVNALVHVRRANTWIRVLYMPIESSLIGDN